MTMTMFTMNPRAFLTELWGDPPPFPVPIQILPQAASLCYEEFDGLDQDLAEYVDRDIYTTLELTAPSNISVDSHPESGEADIGALAGLWAEIEVACKPRENPVLQPAMEQAIQLFNRFEFTPTIFINTGHSLQACWVFEKPWRLKDPEDRQLAQTVSEWWRQEVRQFCIAEGWRIAPVHDTATSLRVPGTYNNGDPEKRIEVKSILTPGPNVNGGDKMFSWSGRIIPLAARGTSPN